MLKDLVKAVSKVNNMARVDTRYLCLGVWERQGLKLTPTQVETFLHKCSPPSSVMRAHQRYVNEVANKQLKQFTSLKK